jgi:hypothetical protein
MIKRFVITISCAFVFCQLSAQFDTIFAKTNIRQCADSLASGFRTKNWELFARYCNPALIGSMGGKNDFMKYMEQMFIQIPETAWKEYKQGKILQVIKTGGDLQTVVELRTVLDWEGRRITTVSHLVGQSWDGGLFWTFFDSEGDRTAAMLIKPDLSDQLNIPKKTEKAESISAQPKTKNKP